MKRIITPLVAASLILNLFSIGGLLFFFIDQQEKNQRLFSSLHDLNILTEQNYALSEFNLNQIQNLASASSAQHRTLYTLVLVTAKSLGYTIEDDLEDMKISYEALQAINTNKKQ